MFAYSGSIIERYFWSYLQRFNCWIRSFGPEGLARKGNVVESTLWDDSVSTSGKSVTSGKGCEDGLVEASLSFLNIQDQERFFSLIFWFLEYEMTCLFNHTLIWPNIRRFVPRWCPVSTAIDSTFQPMSSASWCSVTSMIPSRQVILDLQRLWRFKPRILMAPCYSIWYRLLSNLWNLLPVQDSRTKTRRLKDGLKVRMSLWNSISEFRHPTRQLICPLVLPLTVSAEDPVKFLQYLYIY